MIPLQRPSAQTSLETAVVALITHPIAKPSGTAAELWVRWGLPGNCNCREEQTCKSVALSAGVGPTDGALKDYDALSPSKSPSGEATALLTDRPSSPSTKTSAHLK